MGMELEKKEAIVRSAWTTVRFVVITLFATVMFLPFLWMVCTAFKSAAEVTGIHFWPKFASPENFVIVMRIIADPFTGDFVPGINLQKWIFNSIFTSTWHVALVVSTSSLAAYGFSRVRWPGRDKVFVLYLATMMIPGAILTIPQFQIMHTLGLVNTYRGLIIPGSFSAFGTFMLRQFMLGIPMSYNEAAEIDGASHFQVFLDVILPLTKPGLITLAIFSFLGSYNSLMWPLIMIKNEHLYNVPIGLLNFAGGGGGGGSGPLERLMATTVICLIPLLTIFVCLQKRLVRGIHLGGGVKE